MPVTTATTGRPSNSPTWASKDPIRAFWSESLLFSGESSMGMAQTKAMDPDIGALILPVTTRTARGTRSDGAEGREPERLGPRTGTVRSMTTGLAV